MKYEKGNSNSQASPQTGQPAVAVGLGVFADVHDGFLELMTGSVLPGSGVVMGCGLGVTTTVAAGNVTPPIIVVLPPNVSVCTGGEYVREPQMTAPPELVVVSVAPMMEVVPLITLHNCIKESETRFKLVHCELWICAYGVTVTVNGGGCTELVRTMGPSVEFESSVTPHTGIAVVVTRREDCVSKRPCPRNDQS